MADETEAVTEVEKKAISSSFRAKMQAISGAKYNFTSRINKVETQVKEMNERSKSSSDALKNCFEQVTQQILQEDIMPWLSTEIPQYMAKRRARQRLARREAVEIPVKQAVPEPVPPPSPVPVLAAPSPTSPSPASPTKGFRLAESLLVAGAEFGQPQTQSI
ncbi:unnamed protein product [Effrenium voratum]|uniref:Uncharacterized protein n=1 Tax=Effrenium voratum TaxID=2562239 RepID=A0AA36NCJ0_9DINO|nr:unnamed protein product [Effrenium voratum]